MSAFVVADVFDFEVGVAAFNSAVLRFLVQGDNDSIIIRENGYRLIS